MAKVCILNEEKPSVFNHIIAEIRDEKIQKDRMRFRRNLERCGEIMAYEISKELSYQKVEVKTPLGMSEDMKIQQQPVLITILRAGLPLHQGLLNVLDHAENGYISAFRKHHKDGSFDIEMEYFACPSLEGKDIIISDPMLASGSSMILAYKALFAKGKPRHCHIVSLIASSEGLENVKSNVSENTSIWIGALDHEMTAQSYIVPGLGDAGDLAFGAKE
ncbi:MAG: uracil phosphoribosyltransferase [Flavobacteriales bacterium]|mgnify:CR=1 FL=1|nr:uracil phosphoribosyltransferase [Flavobacteriales bacterium]|tara:strand:- start:463 stop:1119 length:657 start_codon:yes stop_codon:yes gene_type:complete